MFDFTHMIAYMLCYFWNYRHFNFVWVIKKLVVYQKLHNQLYPSQVYKI